MKRANLCSLLQILAGISLFTMINIFLAGCSAASDSSNVNYYQAPTEYNIDDLNQYGQWIEIFHFGRVWQPSVVQNWQPFHNGHWIYSNDNWTWVSYEPFGWIVYHYGYWYDDQTWGWVWIPENKGWSPATVQWRQYDDYVSWAPLSPPGVSINEPWEEKEAHYWHTVNTHSFLKDNVGTLQAAPRQLGNNINKEGVIAQPPQPQNTLTQPRIRDNNGERTINRQSPNLHELETSTGQKINNIPTTKEPIKTPSSSLHRITLPDSERKRVENHQQDIKKNVLVPKQVQKAPDKKSESKEEKKVKDN